MKIHEINLWDSKFLFLLLFHIHISIHFSLSLNHIRKDKFTRHKESFMLILRDLFNHIYFIQRLPILSPFLLLKEKAKKRDFPFSTFLFQAIGSKKGLMDSIHSPFSHYPSPMKASTHKLRIIWENTKHLPYVVLLASLEGWDE